MNLQEQIRKILREELGLPSYLRRRTTKDELDEIFREATQYVLQPNKSFKKESPQRIKEIIISIMMDHLHGKFSNWGTKEFDYDSIFNSLMNYYSDKIEELIGDNRYLSEDTNNPAKQKLERLIERQSLREVVKMMGVDKVSTILETTPLQLIRDFFLDKTFSIDDFNINTGGYDFSFEIIDIDEEGDDVWYVYAKIGDGTVMLMTDEDNEQRDLWNSGLWDEDYWWEIQGEIMEIIYVILLPFVPENIDIKVEHNLM
jgi:hypothetical protein